MLATNTLVLCRWLVEQLQCPEEAVDLVMLAWDTNADGVLSQEEFRVRIL